MDCTSFSEHLHLPFLSTKARKPSWFARFRMHYPRLGAIPLSSVVHRGTLVILARVYLSQAPFRWVRRHALLGSKRELSHPSLHHAILPAGLVIGRVTTSFQWFASRGSCLPNHCGIWGKGCGGDGSHLTTRRKEAAKYGLLRMARCAGSRAVGQLRARGGDSSPGTRILAWCRWRA